jgi:hypothetical protein
MFKLFVSGSVKDIISPAVVVGVIPVKASPVKNEPLAIAVTSILWLPLTAPDDVLSETILSLELVNFFLL